MENNLFSLKDNSKMPRLGLGTASLCSEKCDELLLFSRENSITLFDTAESYQNGNCQVALGHALKKMKRDELFLVSKILPENATDEAFFESLDGTLLALGVDFVDLYLLHWKGGCDVLAAARLLHEAKMQGKIKNWGVSNFDLDDMTELSRSPYFEECVINQVLYNPQCRTMEFSLLPFLREHHIKTMCYGPLGKMGKMVTQDGRKKERLKTDPTLKAIASAHNVSVSAILLSFALLNPDFCAVFGTNSKMHLRDNLKALGVVLTDDEIAQINKAFPPPKADEPLEKY